MATNYKVSVSKAAQADLDENMDWYDTQRPGLGVEFFDEFEKTGWRLGANPHLYQEHLLFLHRADVGRFPHHVFYAINEPGNEMEIIAILHQNRDSAALRKRINMI